MYSLACGDKMKTLTVIILVLLVLLPVGYFVYTRTAVPREMIVSKPATAVVRQGDLLVSVSGSGELVAQEIPLAFSVAGEISELNVAVGDIVHAGEILARLNNTQAELDLKKAQLNWDQLTGPQVLVDAELRALELERELANAQEELAFVQNGPQVWYYEVLLDQALADYEEIRQEYLRAVRLSRIDPKTYRSLAMQLERKKERAWEAVAAAQADLAWVKNYQPDPHELAKAEAQAALSTARLAAQEVLLDVLKGEPLPATGVPVERNEELVALERAKLGVDKAQWNLNQTVLVAPAAVTVTQLLAAPGMRIDEGEPAMMLTELDNLLVRFYLEESDLAQISAGDRLEIRLSAYPDQIIQGSVVQINPALVAVDGSLVVLVWGEFVDSPEVMLLPGMSLEVEVIAAEASQVMIVPLQALRQNLDGSYFVEELQPDGTFEIVAVSVGLKDLANAQILSGLQVGAEISTATR